MAIVEATGTATGPRHGNKTRAQRIEASMNVAVQRCVELGITDPAIILEAKLKARELFLEFERKLKDIEPQE